MQQTVLVLPPGCLIAGPAGAAGAAGPAGAAGAPGVAEGIGYITAASVMGVFAGPGQVLFFGVDLVSSVYGWTSDPNSLTARSMMGLVLEAVDPAAEVVLYPLKVLAIASVSLRPVTVPLRFIAGADLGIGVWTWIDAALYTPEVGDPFYRMTNNVYGGFCGGVSLHAVTLVGTDILCLSEISA